MPIHARRIDSTSEICELAIRQVWDKDEPLRAQAGQDPGFRFAQPSLQAIRLRHGHDVEKPTRFRGEHRVLKRKAGISQQTQQRIPVAVDQLRLTHHVAQKLFLRQV